MARGIVSTLMVLAVAYLLSTGPAFRLAIQDKIPGWVYVDFYATPTEWLGHIPVAGPLLNRYIIWWVPEDFFD